MTAITGSFFMDTQTNALGHLGVAGAQALRIIGSLLSSQGTNITYNDNAWVNNLAKVVNYTNAGASTLAHDPSAANEESIAQAVFEIRRLSGLTWDELAGVFNVSRRSVHNWAKGKSVTAGHDQDIRRVCTLLRLIDQGAAVRNRALLTNPDAQGRSLLDLLASRDFASAMARVSRVRARPRIRPSPLSPSEANTRRPAPPPAYLDAIQDPPDVLSLPTGVRFMSVNRTNR